jgi:hypothetical protein
MLTWLHQEGVDISRRTLARRLVLWNAQKLQISTVQVRNEAAIEQLTQAVDHLFHTQQRHSPLMGRSLRSTGVFHPRHVNSRSRPPHRRRDLLCLIGGGSLRSQHVPSAKRRIGRNVRRRGPIWRERNKGPRRLFPIRQARLDAVTAIAGHPCERIKGARESPCAHNGRTR